MESVDIERYLTHSAQVQTDDLDFEAAQRAGLSEDERYIITYFSDIESQTIVYARDLMNTKGSLDPDVIAFLSMWLYEEFFHGRVLSQLLTECGYPLETNRTETVRETAALTEFLKAFGGKLFSKLQPDAFLALYMTWGAINELTTLYGYETIEARTQNPVLKEICARIAKQERRHFAWYFNNAEQRLQKLPVMQKVIRFILETVWSPVGAGVKTSDEVARLINALFPGELRQSLADHVDSRISKLPGLTGLQIMGSYLDKNLGSQEIPMARSPWTTPTAST